MKTILLLIFLFVSGVIYSQFPVWDNTIKDDTLFTALQVQTDSVYFKKFRAPYGFGIMFDFTTVSAVDGQITFGYSPDGVILIPYSSGNFTLDNTASANQCFTPTGDTMYCKAFMEDNVTFRYIGYMLSKGSLGTDTIIVKYNR